MKTRIVRIGNSRGVRIPKLLLDQVGLTDDVEISAENDALVIRPARVPRAGWDEAFRAMAERGDDVLLDDPLASDKSARVEQSRLARECAKLDPHIEQQIAEEGLADDSRRRVRRRES